MAGKDPIAKDAYRHTQYKLKDGTLIPGVTTVTKMLNPGEGMVIAANKLGLQGVDTGVHWKNLAKIGSAAHKIIEHKLKGTDPTTDLRVYNDDQKDSAHKSAAKFDEWLAQRQQFRFIDSEFQLVSEKYRYGGTGDCYAEVNGKLTYIDFKTGGLFTEGELQGAANAELLKESGRPVEQVILLGLPRTDEEQKHELVMSTWVNDFRFFLFLLGAYLCKQEKESVKKSALREAAGNVVPWEDVQLNAQLRASIALREKGVSPA